MPDTGEFLDDIQDALPKDLGELPIAYSSMGADKYQAWGPLTIEILKKATEDAAWKTAMWWLSQASTREMFRSIRYAKSLTYMEVVLRSMRGVNWWDLPWSISINPFKEKVVGEIKVFIAVQPELKSHVEWDIGSYAGQAMAEMVNALTKSVLPYGAENVEVPFTMYAHLSRKVVIGGKGISVALFPYRKGGFVIHAKFVVKKDF